MILIENWSIGIDHRKIDFFFGLMNFFYQFVDFLSTLINYFGFVAAFLYGFRELSADFCKFLIFQFSQLFQEKLNELKYHRTEFEVIFLTQFLPRIDQSKKKNQHSYP